jgi:hypothetical protein
LSSSKIKSPLNFFLTLKVPKLHSPLIFMFSNHIIEAFCIPIAAIRNSKACQLVLEYCHSSISFPFVSISSIKSYLVMNSSITDLNVKISLMNLVNISVTYKIQK